MDLNSGSHKVIGHNSPNRCQFTLKGNNPNPDDSKSLESKPQFYSVPLVLIQMNHAKWNGTKLDQVTAALARVVCLNRPNVSPAQSGYRWLSVS